MLPPQVGKKEKRRNRWGVGWMGHLLFRRQHHYRLMHQRSPSSTSSSPFTFAGSGCRDVGRTPKAAKNVEGLRLQGGCSVFNAADGFVAELCQLLLLKHWLLLVRRWLAGNHLVWIVQEICSDSENFWKSTSGPGPSSIGLPSHACLKQNWKRKKNFSVPNSSQQNPNKKHFISYIYLGKIYNGLSRGHPKIWFRVRESPQKCPKHSSFGMVFGKYCKSDWIHGTGIFAYIYYENQPFT